jgi:hypothetical protein
MNRNMFLCGHLELEIHGAQNLKLPKFEFKHFKKIEKISIFLGSRFVGAAFRW